MKLSIWLIAVVCFFGFSCKKDEGTGISPEDIAKAEQFKAYVASKKFQISEYYSDKPIDYETDDAEVKEEIDLWQYVSLWIKDDLNTFNLSTGQVTIEQNTNKIEGNTDATIVKPIAVVADKQGVSFTFLNYQYNPLTYRLVEFTGDSFLIYADWTAGAKVFTRFVVKP